MATLIPFIIGDFLDSLSFGGEIDSLSNDGADTTIIVSDSLYARAGVLISIDGGDTTILSVSGTSCGGAEIVISGVFVAGSKFELESPVYRYGTPLATNTEVTRGRQSGEKITPLIYLLLPSSFRDAGEESSVIVHDIVLYFLDDSRVETWLVENHYADPIARMDRLANFVLNSMKGSKGFGSDFGVNGTSHANWGAFTTLKGYIKKIFNINTSGVERSLSLPVYKNCC